MKTKQARIEESIERLKQLKNETILRLDNWSKTLLPPCLAKFNK